MWCFDIPHGARQVLRGEGPTSVGCDNAGRKFEESIRHSNDIATGC
jgi:hypothetical protein